MSNAITYASRDEWLIARRQGLGASEIAAILGEDQWESPFSIWGDKTGKSPKPPLASEAAEWGLHFEEPIARRFGIVSGRRVEVAPPFTIWSHPIYPWKRATPDAHQWPLSNDPFQGPGVLQVKTAGERVAYGDDEDTNWTNGPPLKHQIQLQHEMDVTGCTWGSLVCLVGGQQLLGPFDFDVNDDFLADIHPLLEEFWRKVQAGEPPEVDNKLATAKAISRMYPEASVRVHQGGAALQATLRRLERLRALKRKIEAQEALMKNQAAIALGDASIATLPDGEVWTFNSRFVPEHTVRASTNRVLRRRKSR